MPLITPEYLELQKQLHAKGKYGEGLEAERCAKVIRAMAPKGASVLDYGCGKGHLGQLLRPDYDVREYDPCIEGKDGRPEQADYVVCSDVMEHIEPELVETVIAHLREVTRKRLVLIIDSRPAKKHLADGRNAHLIIETPDWWKEKFAPLFRLEEWVNVGGGLFAVCEPSSIMGPLKAKGVVDDGQRNEHTKKNVGLTWKRIPNQPQPDNGKALIICCYGPSIAHSWQQIEKQRKEFDGAEVVSVSGAHDFLKKKGIRPDWHVECDPRPHKSQMIKRVRRGVKYLMASCCHPDFLKRIVDEGGDLILWHLFNGPDTFKIREELPSEREQILIPGGGSVGLRALVLFYAMGYRKFIIHGFDCSFADGKTHAGPHSNKTGDNGTPYKQNIKVRVEATDLWFETAPVMITYAQHMIKDLIKGRFPGCRFYFMGDGLFQTMLKHSIDAINNNKFAEPPRDYFHLTEKDVEPHEVWGEPQTQGAAA